MTIADVAVSGLKILLLFIFLMNMAALSIWADRRQSAMVQDRVGPNRAVVFLPRNLVSLVIAVVGVLVAGALNISFWRPAPGDQLPYMTAGLSIAVVVVWVSLMVLCARARKHGPSNQFERMVACTDPRHYFYAGLLAHLLVLPLARMIPRQYWSVVLFERHVQIGPGIAGAVAATAIMSATLYAASQVPDGRVGLRMAGLLHTIADAVKLLMKEDLRPKRADKLLFALAPLLAMFPALVTIAVIPFGGNLCFRDINRNGELEFGDLLHLARTVGRSGECAAGDLTVGLQIADLNVGLLYVFAIAGTGIIGAAIAGWASDNKFALLGGLRATSQMISYEVAMGLSIVPMLMICSTVNLRQLVDWQGENTWGIFVQPLAFILFLVALMAETKRIPFDQPEGESEIVAGYFVEYSGMKFGMFFVGEYAEFVFSSVLLVTLFFGGYHLPFLNPDGIDVVFGNTHVFQLPLPHITVSVLYMLAFFGKVIFVWFLQIFVRWTLPRFRYDQLMKLGWTKLLPLALANILVTGVVVLAVQSAGDEVLAMVKLFCDLSQAVIVVVGLVGTVALITWLLEPSRPKRIIRSTSARFAQNAGGVQSTEMQA